MAEKTVKKKLSKDEIERAKNHAKVLFTREGISTQKEIAERVGISEKTIGKWISEEKWDKLKRNFILTREQLMADWLDELAEINALIKTQPAGARFADSKLADVRTKLRKDIKEMETTASVREVIASLAGLLNFIRKNNLGEAQALAKYVDAYIKSLL